MTSTTTVSSASTLSTVSTALEIPTTLFEKSYSRTLTDLQFDAQNDQDKKIEVWLFDDQTSRQRIQQQWQDAGIDITIYAAYKPLLHTLLEQLKNSAEFAQIKSITVNYPVHSLASEKRFLLECYPLASCFPEIRFTFEAQSDLDSNNKSNSQQSTQLNSDLELCYWIDAKYNGASVKKWPIFAPNRIKTDHINTQNLSACGWIKITDKNSQKIIKNEPIITEYEAIFDDITQTVQSYAQTRLQQLKTANQLAARPLFFEQLSVVLNLPSQEVALNVGEEVVSYQEAMHEDIYFSLIELLQAEAKPFIGEGAERTLQVGQIVPDITLSNTNIGQSLNKLSTINSNTINSSTINLSIRLQPFKRVKEESDNKNAAQQTALNPLTLSEFTLEKMTSPIPKTNVDHILTSLCSRANAKTEVVNKRVTPYQANSVLGNQINGIYVAGSDYPLLISGAQHANETSGTIGALRAVEQLVTQPNSHFAIAPIENPDGYALHQAYIKDNPYHIHHAARYTALGDDLEYRTAEPLYEKGIRHAAIQVNQNRPETKPIQLHVNLHGYPSHEWTRPLTGYIPRGFDLWTIPKGFFLIIRHHAAWQAQAISLLEAITADLMKNHQLVAFNAEQIARYETYAGDLPFDLINGFPCLINVDERHDIPITLITEYPDETIHDHTFIAAHTAQMQTVLSAYQHWQLIMNNI